MTRRDVIAFVRGQLERLSPDHQEAALLRATGHPVIVWDHAAIDTLWRVYGATRAISLIEGL